ncbi:hypothetical protein F0U61_11515 [Archangium violaceum]|uniref:hypothetical protein n=1 Tax=Archangium violaceum TaxID=83451 RepID=UPI002B2DAC2A|nr:hypothetical protein F0U61_11515 [Archangium violaceum]
MHRLLKFAGALALVLGIAACPGPDKPEGEPFLSVSAKPRAIDDQGQTATISVNATDAQGEAGTGTVELTASAGMFEDDQKTTTLTLSGGSATATFKCPKAQDSACKGAVTIDAKWNQTTAKTTLQVGGTVIDPGDGGTDGGTDGGSDAGDGGDGNPTSKFKVSIQSDKPALVANTGDRVIITATVTRTADNSPVANGTPITFATDKGSFQPEAGFQNTIVNTVDGKATVSLYVAGAGAGSARVTITVENETSAMTYPFMDVSSMSHVKTTTTKDQLGVESSGRETTTPIVFKLINASGQPVPNVEVSFSVSGAAGASVTPSATTDASGQVTTTLRAGNSVGVAIVRGVVTATRDSVRPIDANHPGTPIVGGKPSDDGFLVDCAKKNLGALHATPVKQVTTTCTAKLVDRYGIPVGLKTSVQWYPEAGSINSPVESKPQTTSTPAADTGMATTIFSTTGYFPPYPVEPLPGERVRDGRNPRDMAVTVIAVVAGEEDFSDGSGPDRKLNGQWDPGEWFVDLGEPLVDRNDNGVWDPGEFFIDTERIDCADPSKPATRNDKWDGPNGCWDGNTQIWRAIHIVYSGPLDPTNLELLTPPDAAPAVYNVPLNSVRDVSFRWGDAYSNQMSSDAAGFTVQRSGNRGNAAVTHTAMTVNYGGFSIDYNRRVATTQPDGSLKIEGLCDDGAPTPPGSDTSPVKTRCVHTVDYSFNSKVDGNTGSVRLTGATSATGGPIRSDIELKASHSFSPTIILKAFEAIFY